MLTQLSTRRTECHLVCATTRKISRVKGGPTSRILAMRAWPLYLCRRLDLKRSSECYRKVFTPGVEAENCKAARKVSCGGKW